MLRCAFVVAAFALGCGSSAPPKAAGASNTAAREPDATGKPPFLAWRRTPKCEEKPADETPARACPASVAVEPLSDIEAMIVRDQLYELFRSCAGECRDCDVQAQFSFVVLEDGTSCDVSVESTNPPDHAACLRGAILRERSKGPRHPFRMDGSIGLQMTDCVDSG